VCLDQSETGLFYLRLDLEKHENGAQVVFRVADVTDSGRVRSLLSECKPEIIFHAAAYKHVPMMESNVHEAVKNNVLGPLGLLALAEESGCKSFVLISSDKAVNPTNIMGATKRACELILSSRPPDGMRCVSVRFGNVLGSNGSVIPVLTQQLQNHEPLTITHPEIKRFFMITREAVALVLQAFVIGKHGDILVLDMGAPVRIVDLARSLIRLSGKSEHDVEIRFIGLREGEKLNEELFYAHEEVIPTSCEKIKRTSGPLKDWTELCRQLEELRASMSVDGAAPVRVKMKEIVPEYSFLENPGGQEDDKALVEISVRKAAAHG
jgi:FlaA1/EpsC-like NDP-sugar epimerase